MSTIVQPINNSRSKIHHHKLALWIACASIVMMFAALTSAYLVRQAGGNWLEFRLPDMFLYSTVVIVLSSITLQACYYYFKNGNEVLYKGLMILTFILGNLFIVMQYQGWLEMMDIGVPLKTNPSGDFIYVISGLHAAHVIGGIAALIIAMVHAFALPFKFTPNRKRRLELTLTYWHFVDFLWIYLLVFFVLQKM